MNLKTVIQKQIYNMGAKAGILNKEAPFMWPVNVNGVVQWQMGNFLNYVEHGFALNAVVYATIMYKVRAVTQAIPKAVIGDPLQPDQLPPSHPLAKLARRPNPYMSWMELQGLLEAYLNLSGNAYIVIDRDNSKMGIPQAMYPVRPDEMYIIPSDSGLSGYLYVPRTGAVKDSVPILIDDVIHIKFPNPMDNFQGLGYGMSPMSPLARSGDVDNSVTRYLKLFFDRGAMPVGLLKYDIPLDTPIINSIKMRWRQIYGGVDNWTDIGVLDSGGSYQKLGQNFDEMGFEGLDERNESRIIGPFGVPPILVGTRFGLAHATYSNYEEARKAFWEDTMMYEIRLFEAEIQHYLIGTDGSYLIYDMSSVPALRKNIVPLVDAATKLWNMGMPLNQAIASVGLHLPNVPQGDIPYIPGDVREAGTPPVNASNNQKKSLKHDSFFLRDQLIEAQRLEKKDKQATAMLKIMEDWETPYRKAAVASLEEDKIALLSIVQDVAKKALQRKATINWMDVLDPYDSYLTSESPETWRSKFVPMISGLVSDAGDYWSAELGTQFNIRNILGEAWFEDYTLEFAQPINETTSGQVHEIIAQAQAEGWSNQQLQRHLQQSFRQWQTGSLSSDDFEWLTSRMPDYRAEAIARTETTRSANAGSQALFSGWGVTKKEWSASIDGRERATHAAANNQIVDMDKPFKVGGFDMMYPGDASLGASADEFVNCRCSVLPIVDPDAKPLALNEINDAVPMEMPIGAKLREFNNKADYEQFAKDNQKWTDGILADDRLNEGVSTYITNDYRDINDYMRKGEFGEFVKPAKQEQLLKSIEGLDDAMHEIGEDLVAYRGVLKPELIFGDVKVEDLLGTGFTDKAFMSTTIDKSAAENFGGGAGVNRGLLIKVEIDKNVRGVYAEPIGTAHYDEAQEEFEIVLEANTSWIVTAVDTSNAQPMITIRRVQNG